MTRPPPPRSIPPSANPKIYTSISAALLSLGCLHGADRVIVPPAAAAAAPTMPAPAPKPDARTAVARALPFLQKDGGWWMAGGEGVPGGGGCISCHHVGFALWSHREAQRAAVPFNHAPIDDLEKQAHGFYAERPSRSEPVARSHLLLGRELPTGPKDAADPRTTALWQRLLELQEKEGYWEAAGQFSSQKRPIEESDAVATMWILVAFGSFPQLDPAALASRDRAFAWLKKSPTGVSNEWLGARLLVERQLGDPKAAQDLLDRLLRAQHPDGGWSWLAPDPSNALSTGQTLYVLAAAGLGETHPAVRRGVGYLLATQAADGTWATDSRLTSRKGGSKIVYIYRYWGTAWATIGLARTLSPGPVARLTR